MRFPPMALLTLVENAVRHGIDPGEEGGRIEVGARVPTAAAAAVGGRHRRRPAPTGRSPAPAWRNLRERLAAFFGDRGAAGAAASSAPHGVRAEIRCRSRSAHERPCTALIADDEPLLRERLAAHLARLWPELQVVAQARNGREAVELFDDTRPRSSSSTCTCRA